jgi:hypothetical protein
MSVPARLPLDSCRQRRFSFLFLFVSIQLFLAALYWFVGDMLTLVGLLSVLLVLFWVSFSVRNTLLLIFGYLAIVPSAGWGSGYTFFHGVYFSQAVLVGMTAVLLFWIIAGRAIVREVRELSFSSLDWAILLFLSICILAGLKGAIGGAPLNRIRGETFFLVCYSFYFIYSRELDVKAGSFLWNALMLIIVFASVEYIFLALSAGNIATLLVTRIVTQQPNLAQIAFPFLGSFLFFRSSGRARVLALTALLPIGGMMFLSQQRALWIGVLLAILLVNGFALGSQRVSPMRVMKYTSTFLGIVALILLAFYLLDRVFAGSVFLTLGTKLATLSALSVDESMNIRLSEIHRALAQWDDTVVTILFGTGLGSRFESVDVARTGTAIVDCSYVYILWKAGLAGLLSYLWIVCVFFKRGLYVFRNSLDERSKRTVAALMSGYAGLLVIGLTNTCLVRYRFIVIWAFMLATIEMLHSEVVRVRRAAPPA